MALVTPSCSLDSAVSPRLCLFFFFLAALGLCCFAQFSLVAVNGGLHCCAVLAPHCCGFSCCGAQALDARAQ